MTLTLFNSVRVNSDAVESDSTSIVSGAQDNGEGVGHEHKARETLLSPISIPEDLTPQHPHLTQPYIPPMVLGNENVTTPGSSVTLDGTHEMQTPPQNSPITSSPIASRLPRHRGNAARSLSINSPKDGKRGYIKIGSSQPASSVVTTGSSDEEHKYQGKGR